MPRWWPGFAWFLTPSGPHPEDRSLKHLLADAPLLAHSWGAWVALAAMALPLPLYVRALLLMLAWQWAKVDDGVYGASWKREVGWRLLIGAVAALPVLWL